MADQISPDLAAWVEAFASTSAQEDTAEEVVSSIDREILARTPEVADDPMLVSDLHRSTRAQWRAFVTNLSQTEHRLLLPEQAVDLARSLARRGMDLGVLLRVYRSSHKPVFQYFSDATSELTEGSRPTRDEVILHLWPRASEWIDDSIEQLIENFYQERELALAGSLARRAETIERLLSDAGADAGAASTALGHPVQHWQTAFVIWTAGPDHDATERLNAAARQLSTALGSPPPLTVTAGTRDIWGWAATPAAPDLRELTTLAEKFAGEDLRVTLGTPAAGVAGFRSSHGEARAAQSLTLSAPTPPPIVRYEDVELLCMASSRPELLHRMVLREVGELCTADKNLALIRETLLVHLQNRQNVEATAAKLFVHKNTVRYRLARAEELLGHPLTERSALVELALSHVSLFGPPAP